MRTIVALCLMLTACGSPQDDPDLQSQLNILLKDPSSVQYQAVTSSPQAVCGELNSKNSYGAYEGFTVFVFDRQAKKLYLEGADEDAGEHQKMLDAMDHCSNNIDLLGNMIRRRAARTREMLRR